MNCGHEGWWHVRAGEMCWDECCFCGDMSPYHGEFHPRRDDQPGDTWHARDGIVGLRLRNPLGTPEQIARAVAEALRRDDDDEA